MARGGPKGHLTWPLNPQTKQTINKKEKKPKNTNLVFKTTPTTRTSKDRTKQKKHQKEKCSKNERKTGQDHKKEVFEKELAMNKGKREDERRKVEKTGIRRIIERRRTRKRREIGRRWKEKTQEEKGPEGERTNNDNEEFRWKGFWERKGETQLWNSRENGFLGHLMQNKYKTSKKRWVSNSNNKTNNS